MKTKTKILLWGGVPLGLFYLAYFSPHGYAGWRYDRVMEKVRKEVSEYIQLNKAFFGVKASITYFDWRHSEQTLVIKSPLYEKYILTIWIPIKMNSMHTRVVEYGKPEFFIKEVLTLKIRDDGGSDLSIGRQMRFGEEEWKKVVAHDFDFGVIGFPLCKDCGLKRFREHWQ